MCSLQLHDQIYSVPIRNTSEISRSTLQRMETGTAPRPSARMLTKISAAYKVKKEFAEEVLLKGDGEDNEEVNRLDLQGQIARDKSFVMKDHAARSLSECIRTGKQTIYLIKAYEKITGKRILLMTDASKREVTLS